MIAQKRKILVDRNEMEINPDTNEVHSDFSDKPILNSYSDESSLAYVSITNKIVPRGAREVFLDGTTNADDVMVNSAKDASKVVHDGDLPYWEIFNEWYKKNTPEGRSGKEYELGDYDYYNYFVSIFTDKNISNHEKAVELDHSDGGHFYDTYKTPMHITYSDESIYSPYKDIPIGKDYQPIIIKPGKWSRSKMTKDRFTPSQSQIEYWGPERYLEYFSKNEPGVELEINGKVFLGRDDGNINNQSQIKEPDMILNQGIDFFKP